MEQRRIVITGVNRGLGRALAEAFVERGHRVWGTSRNGEAPPGLVSCLELDQHDEASVVAAAARLRDETDAIDLLINSAGTDARSFIDDDAPRGAFDLGAEPFNAVLAVNVTGPMLVSRNLLPTLRRGTAPMIVNISSQLGSMQVGARLGKDIAYSVSKAALNMFSVRAAAELRDEGIGVVMVHPGWVATDMGGPAAAMSVEEASSALAATIDALTIDDSGRFVRWDGYDHPW